MSHVLVGLPVDGGVRFERLTKRSRRSDRLRSHPVHGREAKGFVLDQRRCFDREGFAILAFGCVIAQSLRATQLIGECTACWAAAGHVVPVVGAG